MSWIDQFLFGIQNIQVAGSPLPRERTVNFVGGVTGADDPLNNRTTLTFGAAFGGGGVAVAGAIGTLTPNTFYVISLASQDSTASLPAMTADGFVFITFTAGSATLPKKCTVTGNNAAPGSGNIDASINPNQGLVGLVEFSNTGNVLFFWNNSLSYWIQQ